MTGSEAMQLLRLANSNAQAVEEDLDAEKDRAEEAAVVEMEVVGEAEAGAVTVVVVVAEVAKSNRIHTTEYCTLEQIGVILSFRTYDCPIHSFREMLAASYVFLHKKTLKRLSYCTFN